jgi:hypothetical protein
MVLPSRTDPHSDRGHDPSAPAPAPGVYRRVRALAGGVRRTAPGVVSMMPRIARVSFQRLLGRSDYARWSNPESLEQWWDTRTQKLARFVPAGSRVVEFGAGRRQLQHFLAPGCTYFPSDLTQRSPDTIVCDLNRRPLPDLRHLNSDVALFAGVLEYMKDLPSLAAWLSGQTSVIVASYDCVKSRPATLTRVVELFSRSHFGYLNHHTLAELTAVFSGAGFRCVQQDVWDSQKIMVFATATSQPDGPVPMSARSRSNL